MDPEQEIEAPDGDAELSEVFDRLTTGEDESPEPVETKPEIPAEEGVGQDRDESGRFKAKEPEAPEGSDEPEPEGEPDVAEEAERPAIFSSLPRAVREKWDELPVEVRDAVATSHHEMAMKTMRAGHLEKGLGPIRDTMANAVKQFPELAKMRPDEVAADAMELAKTRVQLMRDPVGTLQRVAQELGVSDQLAAIYTGQPAPQQGGNDAAQMRKTIAELQQTVQKLSDPDTIRGTIDQTLVQRQTLSEVQNWATGKEHYQTVENYLPQFVQMAMAQMPGASNADLLDAAYQMATRSFGLKDSEPPAEAARQAPSPTDEAARRAKSVNQRSRGTSPAPMSEDQQMAAVYDKIMARP